MPTLNKIINDQIELASRKIKFEVILINDTQDIFYDQFSAWMWTVFNQLIFDELSSHGNGIGRIRSFSDKDMHYVYIDGNGKIIQDYLNELNEDLLKISEKGKSNKDFGESGNRIAAEALYQFNGKIQLEKIDEDPYFTRTTVEIPKRTLGYLAEKYIKK